MKTVLVLTSLMTVVLLASGYVWLSDEPAVTQVPTIIPPVVLPTVTRVADGTDEYWDGGEFAEQPVYSITHGVSRVAHDIFEACGLGAVDEVIQEAVETQRKNAEATGALSSKGAMVALGSNREVLWRVSIEVVELPASGVYLVTCSRLEGGN